MTRASAYSAIAALAATTAAAEPVCDNAADMAFALIEEWGEVVTAEGISDEGTLIQFWANEATGTFTVTVTSPSGLMCIGVMGRDATVYPTGLPL